MKHLMIVVLVLMTESVCHAAETRADFYVSTRGSDSWSGALDTPNAQRSDGPFATLERARDAVRDVKKSKSTDIVVLIREGAYQLKNTVAFGLEDSGENNATVTYAAYPGETPVFSSGREIKDWQKASGELPGLTEVARGKLQVANVSGHAVNHLFSRRHCWSSGVDTHSLAVDPLFVDPENGDFRFKPGSPALEMGTAPIALSKVGLRSDK